MSNTTSPGSSNQIAISAKRVQAGAVLLGFMFLIWLFFIPDHSVSVGTADSEAIEAQSGFDLTGFPPLIQGFLYPRIRNWSCFSNQVQLRLLMSCDRQTIAVKEERFTLRPFAARDVGILASGVLSDDIAKQMERSETVLILSSRRDDIDQWELRSVQRIPPKKYDAN